MMSALVSWIPSLAAWLSKAAGRVLRDPERDTLLQQQGDIIVRMSAELDARQRRYQQDREADQKLIDELRESLAELRKELDELREQHASEHAESQQIIENQKAIIADQRRQIESYEREARFHLAKVKELEMEIARIKRLLEAQELARRSGETEPRG